MDSGIVKRNVLEKIFDLSLIFSDSERVLFL